MPTIRLETFIRAPREVCFDLARNIDLHTISMAGKGEKAVGGKTSGLIGPGETVTWSARHFGIRQRLTSRVTEYERPSYFVDEMVTTAFRSFRHEHRFEALSDGTKMIDIFAYTSPGGVLGRLADIILLEKYMRRLLTGRNEAIRQHAESGQIR